MKNLKILKKDLNNCSRCGLCQGVCPVYQATKNDCTSPKGRFMMLINLLDSGKKPTKKMKEYMSMCINCGKCTSYCPSKIDTLKINEAYSKDYPSFLKFNPKSVPIIFDFLKIIFKNIKTKKNSLKDKKVLYIKSLNKEIKNSDEMEFCTIPLKFILENPGLAKKIIQNFAEEIVKKTPDYVIADSLWARLEIEYGLKNLKSNINVVLMKDLI